MPVFNDTTISPKMSYNHELTLKNILEEKFSSMFFSSSFFYAAVEWSIKKQTLDRTLALGKYMRRCSLIH